MYKKQALSLFRSETAYLRNNRCKRKMFNQKTLSHKLNGFRFAVFQQNGVAFIGLAA
jgi:hypothetical protein